jgi:hypothetical protein
LLKEGVFLAACSGGWPIVTRTGAPLQLNPDRCRLDSDSVTEDISKCYRASDAIGRALIGVDRLNALLQAREGSFDAFSREPGRLAAANQLTFFRGTPFPMTQWLDVASQLQTGRVCLTCSEVRFSAEAKSFSLHVGEERVSRRKLITSAAGSPAWSIAPDLRDVAIGD